MKSTKKQQSKQSSNGSNRGRKAIYGEKLIQFSTHLTAGQMSWLLTHAAQQTRIKKSEVAVATVIRWAVDNYIADQEALAAEEAPIE